MQDESQDKQNIFEAWAPSASRWSAWVKPVLFAVMTPQHAGHTLTVPGQYTLHWVLPNDQTTIYVLDLPGAEGVSLGLEFARHGVRPIPVYNALPAPDNPKKSGVPGTRMAAVVDVDSIIASLRNGAALLTSLNLSPAAPPAFLDSNRMNRAPAGKREYFDNRSISFSSDFPSAEYLRMAGVARAILVQLGSDAIRSDLAQTLRGWQDGGLQVELKRVDQEAGPKSLVVKRPSKILQAWHSVKAYFLRSESGFGVSVSRGSGG